MSTIGVSHKARIFYKDWGEGPPVIFSHDWPLTADAWDPQLISLASRGFRCIAHDRRSHGRSSQTWKGNDVDTFADDLAQIIVKLRLNEVTLVGHGVGGGEIVRFIRRHGSARVSKIVMIGAVPPLMLRSPNNPNGIPIEVFDQLRSGLLADRSQLFRRFAHKFYGASRPGAKVSRGLKDAFWAQAMMGGHKGLYDCIQEFAEADFRCDLARINVPTLILHGDDDQVVPIEASAIAASKLVAGAQLKIYLGSPHGVCTTQKERVNADLINFIRN
jgi:non-heme chloroperoxidase